MALRDINLVHDAVLVRRRIRRHMCGWATAYALLVAGLAGAYVAYGRPAHAARSHALADTRLRREIVTAIAEAEKKRDELDRFAHVREVSRPRGMSAMFGDLADRMVPEVWFTHVAVKAGGSDDNELTMEGLAYSNTELGELIRELSDTERFLDVSLCSSANVKAPPGVKHVSDALVHFSARACVERE